VVANFNRVIDKVRNSEYRKASKEDKAVYKGTKYLLLKNRRNLKTQQQRQHLKELLALNETINTVMILKEKLKHIWSYRYRAWAAKALDDWCSLARSINHPSVNAFVKTLQRYRYGILGGGPYGLDSDQLRLSSKAAC
jgi:transposase